VRWWNVKHPATYAARLAAGRSPGHGREELTAAQRYTERVMLELRLASGLPLAALAQQGRCAAAQAAAQGLLSEPSLRAGRAVLTMRGRLLADAVTHRLLADDPLIESVPAHGRRS
jgi:oxygen-independent coproporphyrinogen-3 oxidase